MTEKITQLTPEEESLIPVYREKWKKIAHSTEPIDREQAALAVKSAYAMIYKKEPEIIFVDSPMAALNKVILGIFKKSDKRHILYQCHEIHDQGKAYFWCLLENKLWSFRRNLMTPEIKRSELWQELNSHLEIQLSQKLEELLVQELERTIWQETDDCLLRTLERYLVLEIEKISQTSVYGDDLLTVYKMISGLLRNHYFYGSICLCFNSWISRAAFVDFCVSVLNLPVNQKKWLLFQSLVKQCNWIFPLENICFVSDSPRIISFDNQSRLHAEGSPAIKFADGFSIYAYQGVRLPEEYGKIHPNQWQIQWLFEANNVELRRVLIQGIGYERICQELQATVLDNWQEYSLLQIKFYFDIEPICLLKMTCPSTGSIYALRVPPTMESAKEAITWVNWGISPEEFSVQT